LTGRVCGLVFRVVGSAEPAGNGRSSLLLDFCGCVCPVWLAAESAALRPGVFVSVAVPVVVPVVVPLVVPGTGGGVAGLAGTGLCVAGFTAGLLC